MQLNIDQYTWKARVAPGALTVSPVLAIGIALLPVLPSAQKLWSLIAFAALPFAALSARHFGNKVQAALWTAWGGAPAQARLRYAGAASTAEIDRRHRDVERALDETLALPSRVQEADDPAAADAEYDAAVRRLINRARNVKGVDLLTVENGNYGFARNLHGLRPLGQVIAMSSLVVSVGAAVGLSIAEGATHALAFIVPIVVSVASIIGWRIVTPDWVRPSAMAYADRLMEAAQLLSAEHIN